MLGSSSSSAGSDACSAPYVIVCTISSRCSGGSIEVRSAPGRPARVPGSSGSPLIERIAESESGSICFCLAISSVITAPSSSAMCAESTEVAPGTASASRRRNSCIVAGRSSAFGASARSTAASSAGDTPTA